MILGRALIVALLAACAAKPQHRIRIGVLVDGDGAAVGSLAANAVAGLELESIELPAPSAPAADPSGAVIAHARAAYAKGDFDTCRSQLGSIDHVHLFAVRERSLVARALVLEIACAFGALDKSTARAKAAQLASYGLEFPALPVSPDVESLIGDAITASGKAKRVALAVRGVVGARLAIDGRDAGCALPCTVDVAPGDHVVAGEADGYQPSAQRVRVPETSTLALAQAPANAELAAAQWRARIGRGQPATDLVGVALLAKLSRQTRVAYVRGDRQLTGALVVGGGLVATATAGRGGGADLVRELAYDGGVLHRPALWRRPWVWIAVSGAAILVAGTIVALTYKPNPHTRLVVP